MPHPQHPYLAPPLRQMVCLQLLKMQSSVWYWKIGEDDSFSQEGEERMVTTSAKERGEYNRGLQSCAGTTLARTHASLVDIIA